MKEKRILKIIVDIVMTVLILILMAYHITGNRLHEWLGIVFFILFIIHHYLNLNWYRNVLRGKYTSIRICMVITNFLLMATMIGMVVSGILVSRNIFRFLNIRAGMLGRKLHMISAAWGFCLIAVHLGLHLDMILKVIRKMVFKPQRSTVVFYGTAFLISGYGIYAMLKRKIVDRMLLRIEYVFFDYNEPILLFFADYISVLVLFASVFYCLFKFMRKRGMYT